MVDGDSLVIAERPVRLLGIDAPELDQNCTREGQEWACGAEAAAQLLSLVEGNSVTCRGQGTDAHGRPLAVCHANGFELGATMVEYGWATAYRRYSSAYVGHEHRARSARQGARSEFVLPEHHRTTKNEAAAPPARQSQPASPRGRPQESGQAHRGCTIKGNRSRRGEWIYHMPGMQYYEVTRAEEIFCSEAEARAAGYRRSKV